MTDNNDDTPNTEFGRCPSCGKNDGCINIFRDHWFVCDEHKLKWHAGENLFSFWKHQTEAEWQSNAKLLDSYRDVTGKVFRP